jgi:hypothetical protein
MPNVRPTFLVAEPEPLQSLSVRKLVLETSKFNVITAHSTEEALELFRLFPNVSAVVIVSGEKTIRCEEIAATVKRRAPNMMIIALATGSETCTGADQTLSRLGPDELVACLRNTFGDPRKLEPESKGD